MSETTRKAIITTDQVQAAVNGYETVMEKVTGKPAVGLLFDKGARGKGFALYAPDDSVVETFDSKESAYIKFSTFVQVAEVILNSPMVTVKVPAKTATKAAEKPAE